MNQHTARRSASNEVVALDPREDGPWTAVDVERWMVAAYRAGARNAGEAAALSWPALYLPTDQEARIYLHTWAWAKAEGLSLREICRERGWPRETFKRKRKAASEAIARRLNGEYRTKPD